MPTDGELLGMLIAVDLVVFCLFVTYWNRSPATRQREGVNNDPRRSRPDPNSNKEAIADGQQRQTYVHEACRYYYKKVAAYAAKIGPYISSHHILAWATVILTIIAYIALVVTQDTLELTERAWVGPSDAKIDAAPVVGKEVKISITVNNTGRSPATDFTWDLKPRIALGDEVGETDTTKITEEYVNACVNTHTISRRQVIYPTVGFGGGGFTFGSVIDKDLIDDDIVNGKTVIIVQGCIVYNTFKKERHSAFCFFYQAKKTPDPAHLNLCAGGSDAD